MNYDVKFPTNAPTQFATATDDQELPRLGRMLDSYFNVPGQPPQRFVLMLPLPDGNNCRFISNGVGRIELMRLLHGQVAQFLEQVQDRPPVQPRTTIDTSNVTSLLNPE